jgi:hypothetical protein
MQQKTNINPSIYQEMLDSASNAGAKGQSQFFTPLDLAQQLAIPLPKYRPSITDLTAGNGQLLHGAANETTTTLLALDIDPVPFAKPKSPSPNQCSGLSPLHQNLSHSKIIGDLTLASPLLEEVAWRADLFVLNPPWDLHWHRNRLAFLLESDLPSVRTAFAAHDDRTSADTIDSTIATLCLALHFSTTYGEGLLIANASTIERLILADNAPHRALKRHLWATLTIPGNPMTGETAHDFERADGKQASTIVLYFARSHSSGPLSSPLQPSAFSLQPSLADLTAKRRYSSAPILRERYQACDSSPQLWRGVAAEWSERQHGRKHHPYNLWLDQSGNIRTYLSLFEENSSRTLKAEAEKLHHLEGKSPFELVIQRTERDILLSSAGLERGLQAASPSPNPTASPWRVDPALQTAILAALREYHSNRAPLYPLPEIQRLGYLEEEDSIICKADLFSSSVPSVSSCSKPLFIAGKTYPLTTRSVRVTRTGIRPNFKGEDETIEYTGTELATLITDELGTERTFMEGRLRSDGITLDFTSPSDTAAAAAKSTRRSLRNLTGGGRAKIDFTLQDLAQHFIIPEVPDIATIHPDLYNQNIEKLRAIQPRLKNFQLQDYARIAIPDGAIGAHDPGLGKTWKALCWALLKLGYEEERGVHAASPHPNTNDPSCTRRITPNGTVLIVSPGDLHQQFIEEARTFFGLEVTRLDSQETYQKLISVSSVSSCSNKLPHGFYITSYTQLGLNGMAKLPKPAPLPKDLDDEEEIERLNNEILCQWEGHNLTRIQLVDLRSSIGSTKTLDTTHGPHKIKCILTPSLSDLLCIAPVPSPGHARNEGESNPLDGRSCVFDAVAVDEATRMKNIDTFIGSGVLQLCPRYRLVLTATPIKNRVPDLFYLAWWATGGKTRAHARLPFAQDGKFDFSATFCVAERAIANSGKRISGRRSVLTPQACNIHKLWKMMAPIILRRRKKDINTIRTSERGVHAASPSTGPSAINASMADRDIQPKNVHIYRVPMGTAQRLIYKAQLEWHPLDKNGKKATGKILTALRMAAAAPTSVSNNGAWDSWLSRQPRTDQIELSQQIAALTSYTPSISGALTLIDQILRRRQQVILFAPFHDPLETLSRRLTDAGVRHLLLTGDVSQRERGRLAAQFKQGPPRSAGVPPAGGGTVPVPVHPLYPVMLAGIDCMAEGHNFFRCANVIHYSYPWALDKVIQADDRAHRLNSTGPVNSYRLICEGTIDRRLESQIDEKSDAAELILDGHLLGEAKQELNMNELLDFAFKEFSEARNTLDEQTLEQEWQMDNGLRSRLTEAQTLWDTEERGVHAASPSPTLHTSAPTIIIPQPHWLTRYQSRQLDLIAA